MMSKKDKWFKFENQEGKIKSLFMIYAYFESILVPGNNKNQNLEQPYTKKYQKDIACS